MRYATEVSVLEMKTKLKSWEPFPLLFALLATIRVMV
jgi:hypothetical protein